MQVTARELALIVNGVVDGNEEAIITHPAKIEEANHGAISFLANPKYEEFAYSTKATALLVSHEFTPSREVSCTLIRVQDVKSALGVLLSKFGNNNSDIPSGDQTLNYIHESVILDDGVIVGPFCTVLKDSKIGENTKLFSNIYIGENVTIGKNSIIYPGVRIYSDTCIGDNCIIHANAVLGSDGFGFSRNADGSYDKIAQIGNVIIESDVEIGSNTVIDRAVMGSTIIRRGVKLDNLIQVAHNVEIGEDTAVAALAGIAGSTKIGKRVMVGGQAGFSGHQTIADGMQIQAQSGVAGNHLEENSRLYGTPALNYNSYLRSYAQFKNLPELAKKLRDLEKTVEKLKAELSKGDHE